MSNFGDNRNISAATENPRKRRQKTADPLLDAPERYEKSPSPVPGGRRLDVDRDLATAWPIRAKTGEVVAYLL
jgi:hypothetical protein